MAIKSDISTACFPKHSSKCQLWVSHLFLRMRFSNLERYFIVKIFILVDNWVLSIAQFLFPIDIPIINYFFCFSIFFRSFVRRLLQETIIEWVIDSLACANYSNSQFISPQTKLKTAWSSFGTNVATHQVLNLASKCELSVSFLANCHQEGGVWTTELHSFTSTSIAYRQTILSTIWLRRLESG